MTNESLPVLLPKADVVISLVPSTPQTRGMYDAAFFHRLPAGAFFLNAGRGDAVDQAALLQALESGHLAGAAIDVSSPEPLPADDPLWDAPNLILTPHVAGGWHLPSTGERLADLAVRNLAAWKDHRPLENVIAH